MNKRKTALAAGVSAMAICAGVSVYAYFTDRATITNTVTIGSLDIELEEPHWPGNDDPETKNVYPGKELPKDPMVINKGKNPGYIRQEILVPLGNVSVFDEKQGKKFVEGAELVTYQIGADWKENKTLSEIVTKGEMVYQKHVYEYKEALAPGATTSPLFTSIKLLNFVEGDIDPGAVGDLTVSAYAIQSEGFDTVAAAWEAFDIQNTGA